MRRMRRNTVLVSGEKVVNSAANVSLLKKQSITFSEVIIKSHSMNIFRYRHLRSYGKLQSICSRVGDIPQTITCWVQDLLFPRLVSQYYYLNCRLVVNSNWRD